MDAEDKEQIVRRAELPDHPFPAADDLSSLVHGQDQEAEAYARAFMVKLLRLRGVRVDREQFLTAELLRGGVAKDVVARAVKDRPAAAGVSPGTLEEIARRSIALETKKSAGLSFAAGLPGGWALAGTVPGDIAQYYVHAFRVMQKLAYLYGWQSLLGDIDDVDDETLGKLGTFLGVMMGVAGASSALTCFANNIARPALQKQLAGRALTKTATYPLVKQTLKRVGVQINKQIFARTVTKVVPVLGGVLSGGLTWASLRTGSSRLAKHLRTLPPALPEAISATDD